MQHAWQHVERPDESHTTLDGKKNGYPRDGMPAVQYATFWFRPILSELIVAAKESAEVNRKRAPSGPVKIVVTNQPHSRRHTGSTWLVGLRPY